MKPWSQSHLQPLNLSNSLKIALLFDIFIVLVSLEVIESGFLVKKLPGFLGDLPFTLETGYIGVGESDNVQLFYYFVESEGNPENDPLMIWITGGPGCSALSVLIYETGPFTINANSTLEKPMLEIKPDRWTKVANIIYLDQPVGTGFSYAKTPDAYITNDTLSSIHTYHFLRKWFVDHPKFLNNPFYVGADSYAGLLAPMIVHEIYNGNEVVEVPHIINIKGYVLGNPLTDTVGEYNSRIPFSHRVTLLSDAIYKSTKENCHEDYFNVDLNNSLCINDLQVVDKCIGSINMEHVLEPACDDASHTLNSNLFRRGLRSPLLDKEASMHIWSLSQVWIQQCRAYTHLYINVWANRRDVREALHIRKEFDEIEWDRCNRTISNDISYTHNVLSVVAYHKHLANKNCRALVYSGDHDMYIPYLGTLKWIESLNLLVVNDWRPWFVDKQVAGYTMIYSNHEYNLTFATVKGGGHTAPEYKPKECLSMIMRWLDDDAL